MSRVTMAVYPIKNNFLEKTNANPDLYGVHIETLHTYGNLAGDWLSPLRRYC
jgi:hypothetical protein